MTINGRLYVSMSNVKRFSMEVPSKSGPEMAVVRKGGLSVKFWFRDPEKVAYILARKSRLLT